MGERPVRVGAGQQHEHVGPGGEGAPGLDAVDQPPPLGRGGRRDDAGDVGPEVRLGHRHGGEHLRRGQLGQPLLLLLLGAAVDQGPGEDLGPRDQRAADAERPPAQLLGGHHHAHVVALPAGGEAVVLLGDRQPEPAQLGQAGDDLLGDVAVGAVDMLGVGAHLVLGEAVERLAHQLEVAARGGAGPRRRPRRPGWPDRGGSPGSRPPARSSRAPPPRPPLVPPPARPDRPGRRPRRPWPGALRSHRGRRSRGRRVPWPPRRRRAPRRRPRPGWRRPRRWHRTAAQPASTTCWARSTASVGRGQVEGEVGCVTAATLPAARPRSGVR